MDTEDCEQECYCLLENIPCHASSLSTYLLARDFKDLWVKFYGLSLQQLAKSGLSASFQISLPLSSVLISKASCVSLGFPDMPGIPETFKMLPILPNLYLYGIFPDFLQINLASPIYDFFPVQVDFPHIYFPKSLICYVTLLAFINFKLLR